MPLMHWHPIVVCCSSWNFSVCVENSHIWLKLILKLLQMKMSSKATWCYNQPINLLTVWYKNIYLAPLIPLNTVMKIFHPFSNLAMCVSKICLKFSFQSLFWFSRSLIYKVTAFTVLNTGSDLLCQKRRNREGRR